MNVRGKLRALFRLFFLFMVLVSVGVVSAITTIRLTVHGRQEKLPDLVGQPVDKARQLLSAFGLQLKVEDKLYSTAVPADAILRQMPPAGSLVRPQQEVHALVSLGPPQVTIPNVTGSSLRAARITSIQQGLTIGDVASIFWPLGGPDEVVAQDPPAAATNVRSPAVNFLVSLGSPPVAFLCPSVVGQPLPEARRELSQAGFNNIQVTVLSSSAGPAGTVIQQAPLPGSKITPGTVFNFEVAQ
jgi:beta-lactam-binding protein with PASTA domain